MAKSYISFWKGNIFYFLILFAILALPYGMPAFMTCLVIFVWRLLTTEKNTAGAFLLMYAGPLMGVIRTVIPSIPVYGLFLQLIGLLLLMNCLKNFFKIKAEGIFALLIVFAVFGISYILGPQTEFASDKLTNIIISGVTSFIFFYVYSTHKKINNEQLAQCLIISALLMMSFFVVVYQVAPNSIFDFGWLRTGTNYFHKMEIHAIINYQHVGMNFAFAFALYLASKDIDKYKVTFYCFVCGILILGAGARQSILAMMLVFIVRLFLANKKSSSLKKIFTIFISSLGVYFFYLFLIGLNLDFINNTFASGDETRQELYYQAYSIFQKNPLTGAGLGSFQVLGDDDYPHNMLMEILSECGLMGLLSLVMVIFVYSARNKLNLNVITANQSYFFLIIVVVFAKVMVSGDFTSSIQLFSSILGFSTINKIITHETQLLSHNTF